MKLALISDVHSNCQALLSFADQIEKADRVICLGDLIGYNCEVNEVLDYIRFLDPICVLGNHDSFLLHGCPQNVPQAVRSGVEFAASVITKEHRGWLSQLPLKWTGKLDGRSFCFVHGSPWRPLDDYIYFDSPLLDMLTGLDYDVIVFGQTHRCLKRIDKRPFRLNPGSIGQPRDKTGLASMMVLDTLDLSVETIVRPFNSASAHKVAIKNGAGE
jgi:putative phosphoesterase